MSGVHTKHPVTPGSAESVLDEPPDGVRPVAVVRWRAGRSEPQQELVAEEVPVALVYNGISHVVMMATPADLSDFALGFSLSEGIVDSANDLYSITVKPEARGIVVDMTISSRCFAKLKQHRRNLTGRTGCGICGAQSLEQIHKPLPVVQAAASIHDAAIDRALRQLEAHQPLRQATGACHAAAWCSIAGELLFAREDVGRHNALDKLLGALIRSGVDPTAGFILISSRASYEMVQKSAALGVATLVAVSAPTSLALEVAAATGLQLIAFCRPDRHTHYRSTTDCDA